MPGIRTQVLFVQPTKLSLLHCHKYIISQARWYISLIPALRRLRHEHLCEFKARLVYIRSSRSARASETVPKCLLLSQRTWVWFSGLPWHLTGTWSSSPKGSDALRPQLLWRHPPGTLMVCRHAWMFIHNIKIILKNYYNHIVTTNALFSERKPRVHFSCKILDGKDIWFPTWQLLDSLVAVAVLSQRTVPQMSQPD